MFIINLAISIAKIFMDSIRHVRWPAKITSRDNFPVEVAKYWFNRVKPRAISRKWQDFEFNPAVGIPALNPTRQAFGFVGLGIIPDKINPVHMFIQDSQPLDKFQHYLAAFAFVYMVVYLAGICFKRAEDNHLASGFPERRNFPGFTFLCPFLSRVRPHQIRPCFIQIKSYLTSFVHTPKRPLDAVFLTSYSGSGEVIQRLERLYEYPSSAMTLRIHSGLIALIILSFITTWHNPLKLQLLKASPNSLGLLLSIAITLFLCLSLISLGRPVENFWYRPAIPLWLNRLMYLRTLLRCKSTMLAISGMIFPRKSGHKEELVLA